MKASAAADGSLDLRRVFAQVESDFDVFERSTRDVPRRNGQMKCAALLAKGHERVDMDRNGTGNGWCRQLVLHQDESAVGRDKGQLLAVCPFVKTHARMKAAVM